MDKVEIALTTPVSFNGATFERLTMRKMKVKDLVAGDLATGDTAKTIAIFASMANVPIQVIEELDMDDFEQLSREAAPLMGKSAAAAMASAPQAAKEDQEAR